MIRLVCLVIGYVFGLFPTAVLYGKAHGIDITKEGSGNPGTTNSLRVLGKRAAVVVLLGDAFKTFFAMLLCAYAFKNMCPDMEMLLKMYAGIGATLGHNFPFYNGFKGGKGIAATGGMCLSVGWRTTLACIIVFFSIFFTTHYVSICSLLMVSTFWASIVVQGQLGLFGMSQAHLIELYIVSLFVPVMAFIRHIENLKRLFKGRERKTYILKKNKDTNETASEPEK